MRTRLLLIALLVAGALLPSTAGAQLPSTTGWFTVPNTALRPFCPSGIGGNTGCDSVTAAWNSAMYDQARNRLVVWGGGHNDWWGNEIYAINLDTLSATRLTNPATPNGTGCPESLAGGSQPQSRHTYDGLTFIEHQDRMFIVGGSLTVNGCWSTATWTYNFTTQAWQNMNPGGDQLPPGAGESAPAVYSRIDGNVYVVYRVDACLYRYNTAANTYTRLSNSCFGQQTLPTAAVIDQKRNIMWWFGAGLVRRWDLNNPNPTATTPSLTNCGALLVGSGGLVYSRDHDRIVGWNGDNTLTYLNTTNNTCTSETWTGGPSRQIGPFDNGVFKRFNYSEKNHVFVYYGDVDENLRILRVQPAADADFGSRCFANGVTFCTGFENTGTDITPHVTSGASGIMPQADTSQRTSGTQSLRFRIPNVGPGDANMSGSYDHSMGQTFSQNSRFFIQFRYRITPQMISQMSTWTAGGWKISNFHGGAPHTQTCADIEITTTQSGFINDGLRYVPIGYTECGARLLVTGPTTTFWDPGGGRTQQSPTAGSGYNCFFPTYAPEGTGNGTGCWYFQPNTWYTVYWDIQVGTWGSANSTVRAYVAPEGSTQWRQWINVTQMTLNFNTSPSDGWNSTWFAPYMTGNTQVAAQNADTWLDELIVSTQPIALPGTAAAGPPPSQPPAAPSNLRIVP